MALKTYNPTTPSQRHHIAVDRSELWKGKPVKALTEGLKEKGALMLVPSTAVESMGLGGLMGAAALRQQTLSEGEGKAGPPAV